MQARRKARSRVQSRQEVVERLQTALPRLCGIILLVSTMTQPQFPIRLTERAITRIKQVLARQGKQDAYLRIGVRAGGCSGYEHVMLPVDAPRPNDLVAEFDGVRIVIDPKSAEILEGATIDYTGQLIGGGFHFDIPKAKRKCGCGTSFSL
jgi:Iron-sulfur cluster assembly accessory protein